MGEMGEMGMPVPNHNQTQLQFNAMSVSVFQLLMARREQIEAARTMSSHAATTGRRKPRPNSCGAEGCRRRPWRTLWHPRSLAGEATARRATDAPDLMARMVCALTRDLHARELPTAR
jgi:hypothetical protein